MSLEKLFAAGTDVNVVLDALENKKMLRSQGNFHNKKIEMMERASSLRNGDGNKYSIAPCIEILNSEFKNLSASLKYRTLQKFKEVEFRAAWVAFNF